MVSTTQALVLRSKSNSVWLTPLPMALRKPLFKLLDALAAATTDH
jgi:hypothetical protein